MNNLFNQVSVAILLLLLTACASDTGYKVQVEPTLPVPILIVPDHGTSNATDNIPLNNQPLGDTGYKVQVEPTLPVPVLIVPDHGSSNAPVNAPVNAPTDPYQHYDQPRNKRLPSKEKAKPRLYN